MGDRERLNIDRASTQAVTDFRDGLPSSNIDELLLRISYG